MEHGIGLSHIQIFGNQLINNQFSQKFIVPTDVGDVYFVGTPEDDLKYENSNMNIVTQSTSAALFRVFVRWSSAGVSSLMSIP